MRLEAFFVTVSFALVTHAQEIVTEPASPVATPAPVQTTAPATTLPPMPTAPPVSSRSFENTPVKSLRKREHAMTWRYVSSTAVTEASRVAPTVATLKTDKSRGQLQIGYFYNWGHFELGAAGSSEISKDNLSTDQSDIGEFAVQCMINFVKNEPGNDFIPYVGLAVGSHVENVTSSGSTLRFVAGQSLFALGLKWFPLGEIFALDAAITGGAISGDLSGSMTGTAKLTGGGVNAGFLFYF